jgi:F0F1-type ATP synthase assembly protein I
LKFTGLGWYIAACIVLGTVSGVALDKLSGLSPLFMVLGVMVGSIAAFWGLIKMVKQFIK